MEDTIFSRSFQEPFRFQTSQQKRLYTNLRRLGPGPSSFYREARGLMASPHQLTSITHIVAHLLREIESAIRRVLLPHNFTLPEACITCGNRSEMHAAQIEQIVKSLGLDNHIQKRWKEIATRNNTYNGLASLAHREDLSLPRKMDDSFENLVCSFEDVFDTVLTTFEQQSIPIFTLLDSLLKKERPSKKKGDLSVLKNRIPHNDVTHRYFFERLQSPGWLEPLHQADFFRPPPTQEWNEELNRPLYSAWPPAPYLLRMASLEPVQQTVLTILHEVAESDNPFVRSALLEIAQALPVTLATTLVPSVQKWIQDPSLGSVALKSINDFAIHLIQGHEHEAALALVEACSTVLGRSTSYTEYWDYEKLLTTTIPLLVKSTAFQTLSMLCQLMDTALYEHYLRFRDVQDEQEEYLRRKAQEASTRSWRRTIDTNGNFPIGSHDPLNLLVATIRQTAEQAIQEHLLTIEAMAPLFEGYPGRIFRRFMLNLLSCFPQEQPEIVRRYLMDRTMFDDSDVRHEYGQLLYARFAELSDDEQEQLYQWIEAGPDLQTYQEQHKRIYNVQPDESLVQQYANAWRRDWFGYIGDRLPKAWKARYDVLVAEVGPIEPDDIDFTWVGSASKLSIEDLRYMSIDQLITFLKNWQPTNDFMSPSREGLGRLLTALVSEEPGRIAEHANRFQECDPIYISAVIQGFTQAVQNHHSLDWEPILDLSSWVTEQRYGLSQDDTLMICDPAWAWTSQTVANLILSATAAHPPILPASLRTKIWDVLKRLVEDPDLTQEKEVGEDEPIMEYATRAINSIRGTALHAVIQYAWWLHQLAEQEKSSDTTLDFHMMPEVRDVLERHLDPSVDTSLAVRSVYGQHLTSLITLDAQWVENHLTRLFPTEADKKTLRSITWNTYIIFS